MHINPLKFTSSVEPTDQLSSKIQTDSFFMHLMSSILNPLDDAKAINFGWWSSSWSHGPLIGAEVQTNELSDGQMTTSKGNIEAGDGDIYLHISRNIFSRLFQPSFFF